jgi:methyl-accepting chemotaxis protein
MTEVVSAIRRVTDIMGEISAASSEQSQRAWPRWAKP